MIFLYLIGLVLCEEKRYESYDVSHVKIVQSGNYGAKKDWQKISSMTITRLFSGFRYWRSRAIILKHWASLFLWSGNQPFYNPEVPPFKLQRDIIDFADYDNDTDLDDCPLRLGFHWLNSDQPENRIKPIKVAIRIQARQIILHTVVIVTITKILFPLASPPSFRTGSPRRVVQAKCPYRLYGWFRWALTKESHCCGYEKWSFCSFSV